MTTLIILFIIITGASSFCIGMLIERMRWNKLIKQGKIPEPISDNDNPGCGLDIYCEVQTTQYKDGKIEKIIKQLGYINTETWYFKGERFDIYFSTQQKFKKSLVRWL